MCDTMPAKCAHSLAPPQSRTKAHVIYICAPHRTLNQKGFVNVATRCYSYGCMYKEVDQHLIVLPQM